MVSDRAIGIVRLGLGFVIAPAILPAFIISGFVLAAQRAEVDCPVLGPILSALCFYVVAIWRPAGGENSGR
jgi:hypothetical protein